MGIKEIAKTIHRIATCPIFLTQKRREALEKAKTDWERIQCLIRKLDKAQKQLRMYKEFWDNSPDAFLLIGAPDGEILDANPAACSLYGYQHSCIDHLNMADISAEHESTRAVWANRLTYIPLRIHKNADGRKILVTATVSYFNDQGKDIAACIIRPILNQRSSDSIEDINLNTQEGDYHGSKNTYRQI